MKKEQGPVSDICWLESWRASSRKNVRFENTQSIPWFWPVPNKTLSLGINGEWKPMGNWLTHVHLEKWLLKMVCACMCAPNQRIRSKQPGRYQDRTSFAQKTLAAHTYIHTHYNSFLWEW